MRSKRYARSCQVSPSKQPKVEVPVLRNRLSPERREQPRDLGQRIPRTLPEVAEVADQQTSEQAQDLAVETSRVQGGEPPSKRGAVISISLEKETKPGTKRNPRRLKLSERTTRVTTIHFDDATLETLEFAAVKLRTRLSYVVGQACLEFIERYGLLSSAGGGDTRREQG
jgi:hypothetical protein